MNKWKEIWLAYHAEATRIRVFKDILVHATLYDIFYVIFLLFIFIATFGIHIAQQGWWLLPTVVAEVALLIKISSLKEKLVLDEYGGSENSQTPPNSDNHQDTRYLIFKKGLKDKNFTKSHINDCFELVESQIDIASTESTGVVKATTFALGLLAGVLAAVWKKFDISSLILVATSIIGVVLLIHVISAIFPSKLEKLKELKYFMLLYCREMH